MPHCFPVAKGTSGVRPNRVLTPCSQVGSWQVPVECGLCAELAHSLWDQKRRVPALMGGGAYLPVEKPPLPTTCVGSSHSRAL